MSFGKKKTSGGNSGKVSIPAPPRITQFEHVSPTGDTFFSKTEKNKVSSGSQLGAYSQSLLDTSQSNVLGLANELGTTSAERASQIRQRANDFYRLQADNINAESDAAFGQARSMLAKRTGGSLNSTFGADYLARLESNRLSQLSRAGQQAGLFAEDLVNNDEASRLRRLAVFDNFIGNMNAQSAGLAQAGSDLLITENKRAQDLAIARAQLVEQARSREAQANAPSYGNLTKLLFG